MAFKIDAKHPAYDEWLPAWTLMRDAIDGEEAVKGKGETYLPMKSGMAALDDVFAKERAYNAYKLRAEFPEIVSPTLRGAVGVIHETPATIELPSAMEYLRERATPDGVTLDGLHQRITSEVLGVGRYGLIPSVTEGTLYIAGYRAEFAINWDVNRAGELVFAVLDESAPERNPETNRWTKVERYRQLYLNEAGAFVTRLWTKNQQASGVEDEWLVGDEEVAQLARNRGVMPAVPLTFVGPLDLTPAPDDVPLYGLARIAVRIYRLDADYTMTLHMTSEPTPWVNGFEDANQAKKQKLTPTTIGAGVIWILPKDAEAGLLEFTGAGADAQRQAIGDGFARAIAHGAALFEDTKRSAESGEALKVRLGHKTAPLKSVAKQSAAGLERVLRDAARWLGLDPNQVTVEHDVDFLDRALSAQEITALVGGWQSGAYSKLTLFENLQRGEVISTERTFEEEEELIESEAILPGPTRRAPEPEPEPDDDQDDEAEPPGNLQPAE